MRRRELRVETAIDDATDLLRRIEYVPGWLRDAARFRDTVEGCAADAYDAAVLAGKALDAGDAVAFERHLGDARGHLDRGERVLSDVQFAMQVEASERARVSARRPRSRDPVRERVVALMRSGRASHKSFKDFLNDWHDNPADDLWVTFDSERITVHDGRAEPTDGDALDADGNVTREYGFRTMGVMYAAASRGDSSR